MSTMFRTGFVGVSSQTIRVCSSKWSAALAFSSSAGTHENA
jgi:hypothetical protein